MLKPLVVRTLHVPRLYSATTQSDA